MRPDATSTLRPPRIYLTFDDGPHPQHTAALLEVLTRYEAHGTFFVVGTHAEARPDLIRAIADQGSAVGNHTWSHTLDPERPETSADDYLAEVDRTSDEIERLTARRPTAFRPPWGHHVWATEGRRSLEDEVLDRGMTMWLWDIDVVDWTAPQPSVETIVARIREGLHSDPRAGAPGHVVLMHDGGPVDDRRNTVNAVAAVLDELAGHGCEFPALPHA